MVYVEDYRAQPIIPATFNRNVPKEGLRLCDRSSYYINEDEIVLFFPEVATADERTLSRIEHVLNASMGTNRKVPLNLLYALFPNNENAIRYGEKMNFRIGIISLIILFPAAAPFLWLYPILSKSAYRHMSNASEGMTGMQFSERRVARLITASAQGMLVCSIPHLLWSLVLFCTGLASSCVSTFYYPSYCPGESLVDGACPPVVFGRNCSTKNALTYTGLAVFSLCLFGVVCLTIAILNNRKGASGTTVLLSESTLPMSKRLSKDSVSSPPAYQP